MSDSEIEYDSDNDVSEQHSKLIEAVAQLDKGQRVKKAERSEPTLEVSEYHLVKSGITDEDVVRVDDLAKSLGEKGYQHEIVKRLHSTQKKAKLLPKPLEKPASDRIKRTIGFEETKKELGKWNAIIASNRTAEQVFFPMRTPAKADKEKTAPSTEFLKRFRLQSDLQKKLEELDPTPKEPPMEERTENKYEMTMENMILKRKEAARLRAQQSYKEAKACRQRKIKSKSFHRVQRKEKVKQQLKEFEELQKTNPEEALAKLELLDKSRAEERMSLRHKSTGQWAKNKQIRAKYNKEIRQVLAEQLSISRELTQKIRRSDDSDDENEENEVPFVVSNNDKDNPWVNSVKSETEIDEFVKSCRQYWEEKNQKSQETTAQNDQDSKPSSEKCVPLDTQNSSKHDSKEPNGIGNAIDSRVVPASIVKPKKLRGKATVTDCRTILDGTKPKKQNARLRDRESKRRKENPRNVVNATSAWDVEEVLSDAVTTSKNPHRSVSINDMFDHMEEKLKEQANLKIQKIKKQLKADSKTQKHKKKDDEDYSPNLEFPVSKRKPILDHPLEETTTEMAAGRDKSLKSLKATADTKENDKIKESVGIDLELSKYSHVKPKYVKTQLPDMKTGEEDVLDNSEQEEEYHQIRDEAFADDDFHEEFRNEKAEEIKKSQPKDIDLSLPGWGSWAGKNLKKNHARKRRKFILKYPKDAPRKDENKGNVIIFEGENEKLKEHLVSDLPYPFTTVKDFEASIRAPIGRTFVPENSHLRLIQPAVNTKLGQVIEPMNEDVLVEKQSAPKKRRFVNNKKNNTRDKKKKCA